MTKKLKQIKKHRVCGNLVQTNTINIPKESDIKRIFYDFVINHNKKYESFTKEVFLKRI